MNTTTSAGLPDERAAAIRHRHAELMKQPVAALRGIYRRHRQVCDLRETARMGLAFDICSFEFGVEATAAALA